jgi:predicted transcriptional regulator of viral defense system
MAGVDDAVLRELHRAATLAQRAGISIVTRDAPRADRVSGSREKTLQAIDRLAKDGRAVRARRDLLALADSAGLVTPTLEELVDAISPRPYLITGGRALEHHGLTDQHFFELVALAGNPASGFAWRGERVRYLKTSPDRVWGGRPARALGAHRTRPIIAAAERAVMDAIDHPRFGVSMSQAVGALRRALQVDAAFVNRLARAVDRGGSTATARRVGFLVEQLAGEAAAAAIRPWIGERRSPVPLRAGGSEDGPIDPVWLVQVNVDLDLVMEQP